MKQQYAPWIRDAVPIGFEATYVGVYLASDVEARIAELEHQLDIRKAAIEAQFRLLERVQVLEKAMHSIKDEEENEPRAGAIARKALGL